MSQLARLLCRKRGKIGLQPTFLSPRRRILTPVLVLFFYFPIGHYFLVTKKLASCSFNQSGSFIAFHVSCSSSFSMLALEFYRLSQFCLLVLKTLETLVFVVNVDEIHVYTSHLTVREGIVKS